MHEHYQALQIISLQTSLTEYHYQSYAILKDYFLQRICRAKTSSNSTVVILPECTGIWLYFMCVPLPNFLRRFFFRNQSSQINRHIFFILFTLFTHLRLFLREIYRNYHSKSTWWILIQRSWFTLFAEQTLTIYKQLFGELARETNCFIVAGSIFAKEKEFCNMSYVFEPEHGSICLRSGKQYPVAEEIHFIDRYSSSPSIYSIPHTNVDIGVLICADSWMPKLYDQYRQLKLDPNRRFLFIIIALNTGDWTIPWPGYDIHAETPNDINKKHLKRCSLSQAWIHYAVERAFNALEQRQDLVGYGVVCCQGVLNLMNDIRAQGESMMLIKRSTNQSRVFLRAKTFANETIMSYDF